MLLSTLKRPPFLLMLIICGITFVSGCLNNSPKEQASTLKILKHENGYSLTLNGAPFVIKGAGLDYTNDQQLYTLAAAGGNSFRTWGTADLDRQLALAKELGLMVAVGLRTGKELQGFDYNDEHAVAKQFEWAKGIVNQYKDHPNVMAWVIANEPNLLFKEDGTLAMVNPKVYSALGDIIDYIHTVDPHHPVTFTMAGAIEPHIRAAIEHAPNIDFISVQLYGELGELGETITALGIDKPYMVTEFGPTGHWELPTTNWGREIEEASAIKAAGMAERLQQGILDDPTGQVVGYFAFLWGQKQERTPTWYGMFNASGEATARIDELYRVWNGEYPENRAPLSYTMQLNGQNAEASVIVTPQQTVTAQFKVEDPDGDTLTTEWALLKEVQVRSQGGHHEAAPPEVAIAALKRSQENNVVTLTFNAPADDGEYRLFAYTYDGQGHVANANFPFKVSQTKN